MLCENKLRKTNTYVNTAKNISPLQLTQFFLNKEITKKSLQQHQGIEIETAAPLKANSTLPTLTRYTNIKAVFSHNYYFCLRERYKSLSPYNAVENDM